MNADRRERAYATLQFVGDQLDPDMITNALELQPTFSVRKGEAYRLGRSDREYIGRTGVWNLSTEGAVQSDRLHQHLDFIAHLLSSLPGRINQAHALVQEHGVQARISCFWYGPSQSEPTIPDRFRKLVGQIGGEVDTDFYPDDEMRGRTAAE